MGKEAWERQRLKDLYSQMSDGELEEIALDWGDLTDLARQEIGDEAGRRGLVLNRQESGTVSDDSAENSAEFPVETVTAAVFQSLGEAIIAKGLLESAGIESFLIDGFQNMITEGSTSPIELPAIGGVKLQVKASDAEAAKELLSQPVSLSQDAEEAE